MELRLIVPCSAAFSRGSPKVGQTISTWRASELRRKHPVQVNPSAENDICNKTHFWFLSFQSTHPFYAPGACVTAANTPFVETSLRPCSLLQSILATILKGFIISWFHVVFPEGLHSVQTEGQELVSFLQKSHRN